MTNHQAYPPFVPAWLMIALLTGRHLDKKRKGKTTPVGVKYNEKPSIIPGCPGGRHLPFTPVLQASACL